ncbi:hypothetical protein SK128_016569, partial [Halocaridina rubra]
PPEMALEYRGTENKMNILRGKRGEKGGKRIKLGGKTREVLQDKEKGKRARRKIREEDEKDMRGRKEVLESNEGGVTEKER